MPDIQKIMNPPVGNGLVNEAHLAYLRWLAKQETADYERLTLFRDFYDGGHQTQLTSRQRKFLEVGTGVEFNRNFMKLPINILKSRFKIDHFEVEDDETQSKTINNWWRHARMDGKEKAVYLSAFRDGQTFIVVAWDNDSGMPVFDHNLAYDGDSGVIVVYDAEHPDRIKLAAKIWKGETEIDESSHCKYCTIYADDFIYKFRQNMTHSDTWIRRMDDGDASWPLPTQIGRISVVAFRNNPGGYNSGISELEDLIAPQNALNKTVIDLLAALDVTGFGMRWKSGGGDPAGMTISPAAIAYDENPETKWGEFSPSDLSGLQEAARDGVSTIAQIAEIPLKYFQSTGAISSGATQEADDTLLVSKAEDRAVDIGNSWEDCIIIARAYHNVFGSGRMDESKTISAEWDSFARVNKGALEKLQAETNEIKCQIFEQHLLNNVDRELAAQLAGYDDETAKKMARVARPFLDGSITQSGQPAADEIAAASEPAAVGGIDQAKIDRLMEMRKADVPLTLIIKMLDIELPEGWDADLVDEKVLLGI